MANTTLTVSFALCPVDGAYYGVNQVAGSNKVWKLTPPADSAQTGALLSGTWTLNEQTLDGALEGASFDYSRLRWCPALTAFLWTGESVTGNVQAIRPFNT